MMAQKDDHSFGEGFSVLLKHYRREIKGWTQQELADKSGLKIRTIQDLETAQKARLEHEMVSKLADAFNLEGDAKKEFFSAAGLMFTALPSDEVEWGKVSYEFHKSMTFPAFVGNPLMQIYTANSYVLEMLQVDLDMLSELILTRGSLNAMYFLFDPAFNARKIYGQTWRDYVSFNVWFFRNMSRPHVYEARYQKLVTELHSFEKFTEVWDEATNRPMPLPPYGASIRHDKYGPINYWHSVTLTPDTKGEQLSFLFYNPADAQSEAAFARLRADVPKIVYQTSNTRGKGLVRLL